MMKPIFFPILTAFFFTLPTIGYCLPAFPGAEGAGSETIGGRGGKVIEVTNLNDSGPGSLRAAVEAEGPRIVVFRVSGTIQLKNSLVIKNPNITIAGQTAPGEGICLRDAPLGVQADDVVVRFLRVRLGDESGRESDAISISSGERIIFDHCSASWSVDETFSASTGDQVLKDVTV
jgi:pectate lyase